MKLPIVTFLYAFCIAVIELEVGNRSITRMRADFSQYFADPNVVCVIGIKMFVGEGKAFVNRHVIIFPYFVIFVFLSQEERRANEQ